PRSASMPRVLPSFFTRLLKCAFDINSPFKIKKLLKV
ncbi:hypothetical protein YPPY54_4727, partial [Yersinia pestis PY-54]